MQVSEGSGADCGRALAAARMGETNEPDIDAGQEVRELKSQIVGANQEEMAEAYDALDLA